MKKLVQPKVSVFLKSTNQNKPTLNDSATCTNIKNERCKASSKQVLEESTGDSISYSNSEFGVQNGLYRGESNTVECAPTDISPLDSIERTVTTTSLERFIFPKTNTRAFQLGWLDRFQWLEYSVSRDAAYCFVCRQFDVVGSKELAFKVNGFSNWKRALEKNAGFVKHEQAVTHKSAMISWHERKTRIANNNGISELVSNTVLQKRRFYMKTMIEILIFLITNEVAIRGSWDIDNHKEDGVFRNLFEFEISHNKELRKCAEFMPKNATYLSPDIQNELIWTIAKITHQQIVDDVLSADIPNVKEMAVRYVKNGQPVESLLCFETITTFDAETNAELILKTLKKYGLEVLYILSQCYDGANVMRGDHGGIQRIIQDKLGKVIPYVHCFNHRLHLVKSHTSYNFDADDIALSTGILSAMKKPEFVFMLEFMKTFLNTISPADKILQSRDVGFREAVPVIESPGGYDTALAFKFVSDSFEDIEQFMRFDFCGEMLPSDNSVFDYLAIYSNCQEKFKLVSGQKIILNLIKKMCSTAFKNEPTLSARQSKYIDQENIQLADSSNLLRRKIGAQMISLYNDAKRVTLSAWPARQVAGMIAGRYEASEHFVESNLKNLDLQYLTPAHHRDLLNSIVESDFPRLMSKIKNSIATSLRVDGSTKRTQNHNVYMLGNIVSSDATADTIFLGFKVPK
ncbi:Zinc finger MYM-type protein 1 [Pseudolycoriella hygida]|uniref:Zinc finger MYM-type protein 1 n=1 Tax=Pseudolycoriella hygida TaxID=35572 RepID=A0A9Q0S9E9_9DIPT|nr:Zinc finger MYM-type protein 1 [Pseudolycoriella hygida]